MNIKAIIASLVLGSSSAAMAAPSVTVSATVRGSNTTTVVRDHRVDDSRRYDNDNDRRYVGDRGYDNDRRVVVTPPPIQSTYRHDGWHGGGWNGEGMLPPVYRQATLASGMHFASDGRTSIPVGSQAGQFETLQISAAEGCTFLKQVYVEFDNGQEQAIRGINRSLEGNASVTLDLDGARRGIRRIVVYGTPGNPGRTGGTFTVTAS